MQAEYFANFFSEIFVLFSKKIFFLHFIKNIFVLFLEIFLENQ
jgi:hypothetical protein